MELNRHAAIIDNETSLTESSADALVRRLQAGDEDALADLFSLFNDRFHRLIDVRMHWLLRGRLDVGDVLQESYLDARDRLEHFFSREDRSIFVWLRLIVLQRLQLLQRFHLRASKRDAYKEFRLTGNDQSSMFCSLSRMLAASMTSPSGVAVREESVALISRLLAEMEPIDREILMLRHFEQLSNNDAAEVLEIGFTAASNRYIRALRRLKQMIEGREKVRPLSEVN
jgi:RNA polymerase sigma-70 factor, ECF subfamily